MTESDLGIVALTCAAVGDVTAWCLLALVVGVAQARIDSAVPVAAMTIAFIAAMLLLVRPVVARIVPRSVGRPTAVAVTLTLAGLLLSALTAEWIGVHAIFGAFLSAQFCRTTAVSPAR